MPGVLIIEALAQAAAILTYQTLNFQQGDGTLFYFAGIDGARFKRPVEPGDQLTSKSSASVARHGRHFQVQRRARRGRGRSL